MNRTATLPQVDPAFRTIADVVMALPAKPTDADLIMALARAEGIGYRKGIEAMDAIAQLVQS